MEATINTLISKYGSLYAGGITPISKSDALVNMKTGIAKNLYKGLSSIKTTFYEVSDTFGYEPAEAQLSFANNVMTIYEGSDIQEIPYTVTENGILVLDFTQDDGTTEYGKILNVDENEITLCLDNDTVGDAEACTKANFSLSNNSAYIAAKNANNSSILNGTLVTDLENELKNKKLYHISNWYGDTVYKYIISINDSNEIHSTQIEINDTIDINQITGFVAYNAVDNYTAEFLDSKLRVYGLDGGETYDRTSSIYKYDLTDKAITITQDFDELVFNSDNSVDEPKAFTFSSGNMYCGVLWSDCWFDETAIESLKTQLPIPVE